MSFLVNNLFGTDSNLLNFPTILEPLQVWHWLLAKAGRCSIHDPCCGFATENARISALLRANQGYKCAGRAVTGRRSYNWFSWKGKGGGGNVNKRGWEIGNYRQDVKKRGVGGEGTGRRSICERVTEGGNGLIDR